MSLTTSFKLGILQLSLAAAASVTRQIQLGSEDYFLPPTAAWKLDSWCNDASDKEEFTPLTVVRLNDTASSATITTAFGQYAAIDDVWTPSFAEVLYIQSPGANANALAQHPHWIPQLAPDYNISSVFYSDANATGAAAAPGPYFIHAYTGNVYQAYKLYADTNQAFIQSSYQDTEGHHHTLSAASRSAGGLTVAVPSRLYFTRTQDKPLAGLRIAVKDLYDLKGLKTSGGNRALFEISEVKSKTAVSIQKLINAGAIIIGKNKLSEFAFAGPFVTEHIDYLLPFNPRGDGYNSPGDSSGGSAASVASYDWLDASVGSDTGGSIRGPAATNGIHGNRPTQDAVNLTGALVLSSAMDTAGVLARNPVTWSTINRVLYSGSLRQYRRYPTSILLDPSTAELFESIQAQYPELVAAAEGFLDALANLTSANVTTFSVDQAWNETAPSSLTNVPIDTIVDPVYSNLTGYEQWDEFGRDFVKSYMASHDGAFPHMSPNTRQGWFKANTTQTPESHAADLATKKVVGEWVASSFLIPDNETCSSSLYLYFATPDSAFLYKPDVSNDDSNPYIAALVQKSALQAQTILELNTTLACNTTLGSPSACNETVATGTQTSTTSQTVSVGRLASVAGLPDYAVTLGSFNLGQVTYSNSTLQNQSLPLAVDIVAAAGCDGLILDLVEHLFEMGIVPNAKTGLLV